jgi:hypothetical protein
VRRLGIVFASGLVLSALTLLSGIQPNDEGLMLQAAARIADGQVPYRDFWWFYPPGQPYLLGGLWEAFGPSLLVWRIVRVLADAAVVTLVYVLARRSGRERWALVGALAAALAMAYPSGPHPFPLALALALGALVAGPERALLAGVLTGICAAWRMEFAMALGAGLLLGGAGARYALASVGTAAALYAPVVLAAGLGPSFDLLVDYPFTDFRGYQSLPFPLAYHGPLDTSGPVGFLEHSLEPLLLHFLPLVLVIGLAASLAAGGVRYRDRMPIALFALGCLAYLLVRADLFHTAPLAVLVAVLAPRAEGHRALVAVALAALVFVAVEGADRRWLVLREDVRALDLPVADGVRVPPRQAEELERLVAELRGRDFYVMGRRGDRVTAGHPLLYVLAGVPNPTRYDIAAPGVVTSARVQREIVRDLRRARTPVVVRWLDRGTAAPEPNRAGRETGSRLLDDYVARAYTPEERVGAFLLLKRRG